MSTAPETIDFHGQPALRLQVPGGGHCTVALHGAQLLSWVTPDGVERLYLSPKAIFDAQATVRGGVPICFPQFSTRGSLPKHGLVRNMAWAPAFDARPGSISLVLNDNDATRALWPYNFEARLVVTPGPRQLRVALTATNTGSAPWSFTAGLHTYLRVDDLLQARLEGLQGAQCLDTVRNQRHVEMATALQFDGTLIDSIYTAPAAPLRLVQPSGTLEISQNAHCPETVVWNPGRQMCAGMADMPADGWAHMLCVEAACLDDPIVWVVSGECWDGWQQFTLV